MAFMEEKGYNEKRRQINTGHKSFVRYVRKFCRCLLPAGVVLKLSY